MISSLGRCARKQAIASSGASSNACAVDEFSELAVAGVGVAPADVAADHPGLSGVAGLIGAVESEVAQRLELGFDPVQL